MLCHKRNGLRAGGSRLGVREHLRPSACSLLFLAAMGAWTSTPAANWEIAPRIEGGYRYSDNYRLDLPGSEIDVSGAEADARLSFRTIDPRTNFEITPRVRATYFPDEREENSTDYFLRAIASDVTPRRRIGARADFSREDVVRSEIPGPEFEGDLGDPGVGDSGRTFQRNRRDLIRVSPYFSYDISQRLGMELRADYVDAQFDRQFENNQQDFSEFGASAGLGFQTTERSSLMLRALASQYETQFDVQADAQAYAYGAEAEWRTSFLPAAEMYVRLGGQQTESENTNESQTSVIAGLGGRWTSQRNALFLDLTRTVDPIAAGTIVERYQLRVSVDHDVSPRVALLFAARASRDEDLDEDGVYPTREYATAEAGFEWRWQRFLAVRATYNYFWQEYADEPSDASANGFLISVVYEPKRRD